ncbi:low molecular weight protein-tyrosine-phosphatase [Oleiagrimonas sp. C23AA]|uniref:low molecular weight protein-tyrosine-phosphatase n=1 Tax=Oleiagrimonas sp. C23AA TaxID=2719047 RepID=UPI001420799C|nr:low molecular weight protein-tyrosine-phosphatase [Oleiagrimonas sp. C23AA]NII10372.1 low molecular weight phosphotyrosine protein phosphatase [Oleiagrimonas sp. C23AA]
MRILFVCLGNICRSPLVEAVAREEFARAGLHWSVDSCGTGGWHVGEGADPRSAKAGASAGYSLAAHRGRQLCDSDYRDFDWLLAMDTDNLIEIERRRPLGAAAQVGLFLDVAGIAGDGEVPDPYYGGEAGFAHVLDLARTGVEGLMRRFGDID